MEGGTSEAGEKGGPRAQRAPQVGRGARARAWAAGALVALLLGGYVLRTVDRNWDWEDEERLFRAAYKVRRGLDSPSDLTCCAQRGISNTCLRSKCLRPQGALHAKGRLLLAVLDLLMAPIYLCGAHQKS